MLQACSSLQCSAPSHSGGPGRVGPWSGLSWGRRGQGARELQLLLLNGAPFKGSLDGASPLQPFRQLREGYYRTATGRRSLDGLSVHGCGDITTPTSPPRCPACPRGAILSPRRGATEPRPGCSGDPHPKATPGPGLGLPKGTGGVSMCGGPNWLRAKCSRRGGGDNLHSGAMLVDWVNVAQIKYDHLLF